MERVNLLLSLSMASKVTFLVKVRSFMQNLNNVLQCLSGKYPPTGMPALCYDGGYQSHDCKKLQQSILEDIFSPLLRFNVPRSRRTVEKRKMRKFTIPEAKSLKTKNIIICLTCGHPHEIHTICGNCYDKVRQETAKMKNALGDYSQLDTEIGFLYKTEKVDNFPQFRGRKLFEMDSERPSWFSALLLKPKKNEET